MTDRATGWRAPGLRRAFLMCLMIIGAAIAIDLAFFAEGQSFKREGGGLETISAVLYIVAALGFFVHAPGSRHLALFHVPALMVLFGMRELDFDKAFTGDGILSLRLYSGDAALFVKLIGGTVAVFAVYVIARNVIVGGPAALRALRVGKLWPWFAVAAAGLVVVTKSIDGLARKLAGLGIEISGDVDAAAALLEEVGEAFIPVCAILAIMSAWPRRR